MWDAETLFSEGQEVTGSANSENVLFTGYGDAGGGQAVRIEIDTPAVTGTGTVTVELQHSDTADGTFETKQSWVIDAESLAKGGPVQIGTIGDGLKDYLRLNYVVSGVTGFKPTAGLVDGGQTNR